MQPVFRARRSRRIVTAVAVALVVLATLSGVAFITHRALSAEGYVCRIVTHVATWGKSTRTVTRTEYGVLKTWEEKKRVPVGTSISTKTIKYGPSVTSIPALALPKLRTRQGTPSITYGVRYSTNPNRPVWEAHGVVVEGTRMEFRHDLIVSSEPDCVGEKEIVPIGTLDAMEVERNEFGRWAPDYGSWLDWHFNHGLGIEKGIEETMIWMNWSPPT